MWIVVSYAVLKKLLLRMGGWAGEACGAGGRSEGGGEEWRGVRAQHFT